MAITDTERKHILVVEDDPATVTVLKVRLEAVGFQVHTEEHGRSALTYAAEHRPDLAILDLRLPDLSGYEVARELRNLSRPWTIPILMLTGMNRPVDQLRGFAYGADAYLTKPYNGEELLRTVALLLNGATGLTTPPKSPGNAGEPFQD